MLKKKKNLYNNGILSQRGTQDPHVKQKTLGHVKNLIVTVVYHGAVTSL